LLSGLASAAPAVPEQALERPDYEQMSEFAGPYRLDDGRRVEVVKLDSRLYADLGRRVRVELFVAGPGTVASRDGRVTLRQAQSANERVSITVVGSLPAGAMLSSL
jgi:hypothetical protein